MAKKIVMGEKLKAQENLKIFFYVLWGEQEQIYVPTNQFLSLSLTV